jgi:branched-chain amino acid transport system substrate-binding protein
MPESPFYRAGDHQLMPTLYVGQAQAKGSDPEDLFKVTQLVKGPEAAGTVEETGCKLAWPA